MAGCEEDILMPDATPEISLAEREKTNPQENGWDARVPLNYEVLAAKQEDEAALREAAHLEDWLSKSAKYEWSDEYGDVGPEVPALEAQLFDREFAPSVGDDLAPYTEVKVTQEGPTRTPFIRHFKDAGLHPVMLKNVELCGYLRPLPVQAYCIPAVLTGNDIIAVAQTGSGKTAAYLIPVLSRLMGKAKKLAARRPNPARYNPETDAVRAEPLVLIVCPTRELATQIFDEARRLCYRSMLRPCVVYGGAPRRGQLDDLKKGCDVLIGTAGRLNDFLLRESRWLGLNRLKYTILDEADEMLQPDWEDEMKLMLGGGSSQDDGDHQYLMFSATFPAEARKLARQYLSNEHVRIHIGRIGSSHTNVKQDIVWVNDDKKPAAVVDLLMDLPPCRTMIFVNTNHKADFVDDFLYNQDFPVTSIHSNRTQREREDALRAFKTGKCPIMVATAIGARGIDIKQVMHVINYDMPNDAHGGIDEYVHRIGRTARLGNKGQATSFYNEKDIDMATNVVKILMECNQSVPDFLQEYMPADGIVFWSDNSSNDGTEIPGRAEEPSSMDWATNKENMGAMSYAEPERVEPGIHLATKATGGRTNAGAPGWGNDSASGATGWGDDSASGATGWGNGSASAW